MVLFEIHRRFKGHFLNKLYASFNFKIYDVTTWLPDKCNTHIAQYLENINININIYFLKRN